MTVYQQIYWEKINKSKGRIFCECSLLKVILSNAVSAPNMRVVSCPDSQRLAVTTNFPYRATSVSASNVMKPAECRTLYQTGSVPEITQLGQLRRLPLLQNLLRKVKHTLHFYTETANHADNSWDHCCIFWGKIRE